MKDVLKKKMIGQEKIDWGLIGSCTNSSYEDLSRASSIANQALNKNLSTKAFFGINPGSSKSDLQLKEMVF